MITKRRHIVLALSAALMLGATAMPASAKPGKWKTYPQQSYASQNHAQQRHFNARKQFYPQMVQNQISAAEAKSIARRRVKGGEVVDISRRGNTYRVRVIAKDGRVVDVLIDANTGRVKR